MHVNQEKNVTRNTEHDLHPCNLCQSVDGERERSSQVCNSSCHMKRAPVGIRQLEQEEEDDEEEVNTA